MVGSVRVIKVDSTNGRVQMANVDGAHFSCGLLSFLAAAPHG